DDEESFCRMVKLNLEETGKYEVRAESQSVNAIRTVKEFKPDLILLDIVMPNVDGGEISQKLRSDEDLKNIPIVFLTAIVTEREVRDQNGIISGRPFLAKPVPVDKLIYCIEQNTLV
ncbi:MAG: response regulator, partial [Candidatus Omnitrophica bacterium]|nr:response regulator [Candidatus Omnitrophota bacterium]